MTKLKCTFTHQGQVAHLTMTSPENLNAMDDAMAEAFRGVYPQLESQNLRAVVITGEGRAFSAGGDLAMLLAKAEKDFETNRREMLEFYRSFLGLRDLNVPLVCGLQGHSVGAGFCFAAACDLRMASSDALFAAPFTRLGLHPGMGGSFFLPRGLGSEAARDLMLTGRRMGAVEARSLGFLSDVVDPSALPSALDSVLKAILTGAPLATRALLKNQREVERPNLEAALRREAAEQAECYARAEFREGIEALSTKRAPDWSEAVEEKK